VLRFETPSLKFKRNEALQVSMIEEQIQFKVLIANLNSNLFSNVGADSIMARSRSSASPRSRIHRSRPLLPSKMMLAIGRRTIHSDPNYVPPEQGGHN